MNKSKPNTKNNWQVEVINVREVTPHNKVLMESGKKILMDSIVEAKTFCRFMITLDTGAIPIYLSLLKLMIPNKFSLAEQYFPLGVLPPLLYLSSLVLFAIGLLPQKGHFNLDVIEEIEFVREKIIRRLNLLIIVGFSMFVFATLSGIFILLTVI